MAIGGDDAPAAILARVLAGDLAPTDTHPAIMRALQSDQVDLVTRQRALVAATHDCRRLIDSPAATASLIARIIAVAPDLSDPDAILRCLINLVTGYGMTEADIEPVVDAVASCLPGTAYGHIALRFIDVCVKADMITQGAVERVVVALCQAAAMQFFGPSYKTLILKTVCTRSALYSIWLTIAYRMFASDRYLFISREIDDASASMVLHIERAWTALVNVLDAEADAQVFFAALDSVVLCCQDFNIVSLVDVDRLVSLLSDCLRAESLTLLAFIDRLSPVCLRAVITCLTVLLQNRYHLEDIAYSESVETCFHGLTICAMSCPALLVPHLSKVVAVLSSATSLSEAAVWATLECLYVFATFLDIIDSEALAVVAENTARVLSALIQILETVNARPAITHLAQRCTSLWFIKLDRHGRGVNYRALGTVLSNLAQRSSNACCLQDFMHRYSSTNDAPEFHMLTLPDRLEEITHRTLAQKIWAGDNAIVSVEILTSSTARVTVEVPSCRPPASWTFCNHRQIHGAQGNFVTSTWDRTVLSCLPEFVIDQAGLLVHGQVVGDNLLTCLSVDETLEGSLSMLDQMPCQDTMKFGVIYVGYDQTNEVEILGNTSGSPLYERFLRSLGRFIPLRGSSCYSGGLDRTSDDDGCVALIWNDCLTRICFHVATLMPNYPEQFPHGENKKRHIGNDYVNIVYSDNCDAVYEINTIPSQLNFVNIVVRPVGNLFFRIDLIMKNDVLKSGFTRYCRFAPFATLAATVRHLALHAQITCCNLQAKRSGSDCVSNWQSRLQQIQRIKERHTI
ncbi:unnamed protein product (mitochondrion) [Plasmodiophora brassicae]|uniref:Rap-GAP domain-containing protein n=1 Tax=Plasmodiophora brassicae TaxID=37360 RepID=A0A3P3YCR2_PLABS|nr:unnamed protein product [Plasmodiophora brassicae]